MITLLSKNYKQTDYDFLYAVLDEGLRYFNNIDFCKDKICSTCPYKNACDDINRLSNYLSEKNFPPFPVQRSY